MCILKSNRPSRGYYCGCSSGIEATEACRLPSAARQSASSACNATSRPEFSRRRLMYTLSIGHSIQTTVHRFYLFSYSTIPTIVSISQLYWQFWFRPISIAIKGRCRMNMVTYWRLLAHISIYSLTSVEQFDVELPWYPFRITSRGLPSIL